MNTDEEKSRLKLNKANLSIVFFCGTNVKTLEITL